MNTAAPSLDARPYASAAEKSLRRRVSSRAVPGAAYLSVSDPIVMLIALGLTLVLTNRNVMPHGLDAFLAVRVTLMNVLLLTALGILWAVTFRIFGLYRELRERDHLSRRARLLVSTGICAAMAAIFLATGGDNALHVLDLAWVWCIGAFLLVINRVGLSQQVRWRRRTGPRQRVVIVGSGPVAMRTYASLLNDEEVGYDVIGFVDDEAAAATSPDVARRIVTNVAGLESLLMRHAIDEVFVALPVKSRYLEIHETLRACERVGVRAKYRADFFDTEVAWPRYEPTADHVVTMQVAPDDVRLVIKRAVDLVGSAALLVLLSPVIVIAAIAVKTTSAGPAFFSQDRYGLNRRRFRMFKFRTMVADAEQLQQVLEDRNEADGPVFKIDDDPRITRIGRFLRRTSIDELPQLLNVLKGEMSLVGPRPLPLRDVQRFTDPADMRRCSVRPGLTCLWQVSGRNNLSFDEWMRFDLDYIDSWSLTQDFIILARTIPAVLQRTGAR